MRTQVRNPENAPVMITPEQFLKISKAKTVGVVNGRSYADNSQQQEQLPQAGLGAILKFTVQGTVQVAGTVTSGTFRNLPNPAPWSLIKNLRITSNNALNLRDMSGWGLYKWVRYRYGIDPTQFNQGVQFSTNTLAALGMTGTRIGPGGTIAATTYNVNFTLPIDIAFNRAGTTGLIVLQYPSTYYYFQITWGSVTSGMTATGGTNDIFQTLVGTGLTYTVNLTWSLDLEYYDIPDTRAVDYSEQIGFFLSVTEQIQTPLNQGENTVRLPPGDLYSLLIFEFINNSLALTPAQMQLPKFQHSGSVWLYNESFYGRLNKDFYEHELPPVDGCLVYDLGIRQGRKQHRDINDTFNNMNVTDAQVKLTIPSTVTISGTNQLVSIFESLRSVSQ